MRIAFLGTPDFAIPPLSMLYESGHTLHVFTQPDRPVGRRGQVTSPATKVFAVNHGIPVSQFERIRNPEGVSALRAFAPDLMVTAAFGQILSLENLSIPTYGCINVHGSLLPKYRGAAPIQWAIINGETITGITTMLTDEGMDTGDILLTDVVAINPNETAGELYARLSVLGAQTLGRTIDALMDGTLKRTPQDPQKATKCVMLKKEHGRLNFSDTAQQVHNRVRGTNPWPGAFAYLEGSPIKIWETRLSTRLDLPKCPVGTCLAPDDRRLFVRCDDEPLEILELQLPGGKRQDATAFLRGHAMDGKRLS